MSDLQHRIADLSPERRKLLELLYRQQTREDQARIPQLPRTSGVNSFPLSFAQQRLWFIDQLQPGSATYNLLSALRLTGPLDAAALSQALNVVVQRHETLRTTFIQGAADEQPLQVVAPTLTLTLPISDLTGVELREREAAIQRWMLDEARRPFDLACGPLLRARLLRLGAQDHRLIVVLHHIIADGWSQGVLVRELTSLYAAFSQGRPSPLAPLPIQYADFAVWQRQRLRDKALAVHLDYWKRQLADLPKLLLPTDYPRTAIQTITGARQIHLLPPSLMDALKALSQREGATLFQTLLTALQVLLQRYTGQNDIAVGSAIASRNRAEVEPLIGFFVNTLVLRANLAGNPTFRDTLRQVRETTLAAYAHQDLPFEKLVEVLQPERDLSTRPLTQVFFVLQNTPRPALSVPPLTIELMETEHVTAAQDLALSIVETPQGLRIRSQYNADLFAAETITRIMGHFHTLLAALVANPDERIAELPLLTEAERQQMLIDWNRSEAEYPRDAAVHQLFEAQAARTPHTRAIVFDGQALSYAELNTRANQLAHYLRAQGVGPDVLVALCVERSLEMIVGMLAILKAGGAYLPLDPTYPAERLQYMLSHSRAPVLLTQAALVERLPEHQARVFRLDADWPLLSEQPTSNPARTALPEHLAYLIFTSGSTGKPKGVMVTQRGLINLVFGLRAYFADPAVQTTGLITSISFDISVNQIFPTLFFGRTLHIIPDAVKFDSRALLRYLHEQQVHLLDAVPSYMQAVLNEVAPEQPPNALRYLLIGGEKIEQRLLQSVCGQLGPQVQVVNIYGLTEISDINILGVLRADDLGKPVTVGTPLQNNRIYILDQHQQPQPIGLAGEICIAGESVSRGYLFRPDLTAERFVPCPFEDGALMVRTGDLGRWLPNGTVEILGRIDHQVKIRGFRIETGEIEAVLAQHPGIDECAVVAREDGAGDQRLVAYMVEQGDKGTREPKNKGTGHAELETWNLKLHAYLARHLPAYMIPAAFVVLDALPKTPSGKLDRNALPAPGEDRPTVGDSLVAPRTPIEEIIAEVWAAVLKVRPIGVHDNFFTLGGHSLLATQAITRLRQIFDRDIPLRLLFEAPTIAELAPRLAQEQIADALPLRRVPRDGTRLPLSSAQQRLWFLDQVQPSSTLYSIPLVLRLSGSLDHAALERSLNVIVERHEVLRTTFAYDPDAMLEPYQQIRPPGHVPLPLVALPATADEEYIRQAVLRVVRQPFDFQNGPLLRGTIFQRHPTEHILAFVIHHSIFDGWSQSVLLRELTSLYRGFVEGVEVVLPPLPVQYGDYAMWQRQWLAGCPQGIAPGDILGRQLGYWQQQLANCPPLDLPLDHPRPTAPSDRGDVVAVPLGAALSTRLRHLSQRLGSTLYMTLLAAWQTLLYRYSGQTDIAVGTPIAGRLRPELEGLIGCFVNTLVLRSSLAGNPRFAEVVARVRATALEAYAHQDLPFEVVVEHIQPERDLGRTPLFQVMFTLQNTPRAAIELPDLTLEPLMLGPHTAKFDLSLSLSETPDGLRGAIEYRTDLFEARTIARMAAHYQILLSAITSDPDQPIDRLPLLAEAERQRLLARRPRGAPTPVCVHHLIAAQTARTPDALAVQYQDRTLTYRQLDQRANQIAHHLQSLGVRPDVRVGVCLDRAPELIVALLGILKAGGAYVPLDPTYPQERLFFMAQDAGIAVLITDQALRSSLPCYEGPILWLDRDAALIDRQPLALPDTSVAPDHLMYVIYTSGSTGQPKGVLITHRAVVSYLAGVRHRYTVLPNDRVLLFASIGFDASVEELFVTLTTGATVVLRTDEMLASPQAFMEHCRQWQITVLSLPTAFWHVLADASATGTLDVPPSVRMVIIGGEQAARDHVRRWQEQLGDRIALVNVYGPTETTVAATAYVVPSALPADRVDIPIGLPLAHARAYILDRQIQLVPPGLPGELYIGGESLARGYLNRPDLTAERFIPDPFSDEHAQDAGARLYKTGDLVRYGRDGMLVFLGRVDSQVKLRGFRIELSEIEVTLRQHPGVHEAVVLLREDHPGEQQLVAYVVEQRATEHSEDHASPAPAHAEREPGGEGLTSELREFLGSRLPAYMVPSAFVLLDALPRTPTDKIDRRALPAPTAAPIERQPALATPHDQWELWLSQLWADLLHRPVVGVTENFFALGGHSLLAVRLMAHVQQRIGRALPLAALIQAPTIRQLAAYLRRESPAEPWTPIVPLRPHGDRPPLFLIHPIGGTVFCYTALVCHLDARRQVYGLQARGVDAGQTPHTSIRAMAAEYVAAIRTIQPHGPYLLGGWSMGGVVAFEVAQQFRQHGQQVDLLALIDSGPPSASRSMPDDATLVAAFARDLAAVYGKRLVISREELADLPVEQRLSYVLMQARRQASVPPDITEEQISQLAATFRAHLVALHTYAPAAPAERAALLEARPADAPQPSRAERWRAWSHHLEVVQHSADHYGLMHPPHVQAVAAWLEHQLMQAIRPA